MSMFVQTITLEEGGTFNLVPLGSGSLRRFFEEVGVSPPALVGGNQLQIRSSDIDTLNRVMSVVVQQVVSGRRSISDPKILAP